MKNLQYSSRTSKNWLILFLKIAWSCHNYCFCLFPWELYIRVVCCDCECRSLRAWRCVTLSQDVLTSWMHSQVVASSHIYDVQCQCTRHAMMRLTLHSETSAVRSTSRNSGLAQARSSSSRHLCFSNLSAIFCSGFFAIFGCCAHFNTELQRNGWSYTKTICVWNFQH